MGELTRAACRFAAVSALLNMYMQEVARPAKLRKQVLLRCAFHHNDFLSLVGARGAGKGQVRGTVHLLSRPVQRLINIVITSSTR